MMKAEFERQMINLLGRDEYLHFCEAMTSAPVTGMRPNGKCGYSLAMPLEKVPWSSCGYRLPHRVPFTFDPLFHAGGYYVQEPSSMFVETAFRHALQVLESPDMSLKPLVLDLCAAPGGKSTLLRSILPEGSHIVANEPSAPRAMILMENLIKWGHPDVTVTSDFPETFGKLTGAFDVVIVDAPCSGEGMFRKDVTVREQWTPALVQKCAALQRRILGSVWPALRDGGCIIYSTCTYNTSEDEGNVAWMVERLGAEVVNIPVRDSWNITGNLMAGSNFPVYHFMPHHTEGEGFFLTLLRKKGRYFPTDPDSRLKVVRRSTHVIFPVLMKDSSRFDSDKNKRSQCRNKQKQAATAETTASMLFELPPDLMSHKKVLAEPQSQMALRLHFKELPNVDVDYIDALRYLRREALTLSSDASRGIVAVTYEGHPLGFANQLGTRANNLYPQAWRILSSHLPEKLDSLVK